jgi:rare lipoprotein A (peptidoglycan hydrolase)
VTRRAQTSIPAILSICLAGLALPALGVAASGARTADTGGSAMGPSNQPAIQPASGDVSSSSNGVTISATQSAFLSNQLVFTGSVPSADAGDTIVIQRLGHQTQWQWAPTAQTTVGSDGSFTAVWDANHIGQFSVRAVLTGAQGGSAASAWPTVTVTVYRSSMATQYGPGFYGHRTACGETLRPQTIGVANRTLPCGTKVAVYYQGQMMVVPVIDRGPYGTGADWDLTEATGQAMGIAGTARVGAVSLPRPS